MKQIQITFPTCKLNENNTLAHILRKEEERGQSFFLKFESNSNTVVIFRATDAQTIALLRDLNDAGVESYSQIDVLSLDVSKPEALDTGEAVEIKPGKIPMEVIRRTIRAGNRLSFTFWTYLVIACIIAGVGMATNNAVSVVAAMLVSPLMGPILSIGFAPVVRDKEFAVNGLRNEALALLTCLGLGSLIGIGFLPFGYEYGWPTEEMSSRGDPRNLIIGALIAIPSGAGVALSVATGGVNSLVGVAISASLLPPAVNCGMNVAYGVLGSLIHMKHNVDSKLHLQIGLVSFALTLVNIVCICLTCSIFFWKIKHLRPLQISPITYSPNILATVPSVLSPSSVLSTTTSSSSDTTTPTTTTIIVNTSDASSTRSSGDSS